MTAIAAAAATARRKKALLFLGVPQERKACAFLGQVSESRQADRHTGRQASEDTEAWKTLM